MQHQQKDDAVKPNRIIGYVISDGLLNNTTYAYFVTPMFSVEEGDTELADACYRFLRENRDVDPSDLVINPILSPIDVPDDIPGRK